MKQLVFILTVFSATCVSLATVRLPAVISDHMVIQCDQSVPIWGWAEPGEEVNVTIGSQQKKAVAGSDGKWSVKLDPIKAGGTYEIVLRASNTLTVSDVLVGEVWLCAGQSNMGWRVARSNDSAKEIAEAKYPQIRMFTVEKKVALEPQANCKGAWQVCSPETVGDFTAVGYFFGRRLHQELKVPVGLIHSSWLGTPAETWISKSGLEADPEMAEAVFGRFKKYAETYPAGKAKYEEQMKAWQPLADEAKAKGQTPPKKPSAPYDPETTEQGPNRLYNAMIAPLVPYAIRGCAWYQGEGNIDRGYYYRKLFPALIRDYRRAWGQGDFPFYYCQIGSWRDVPEQPKESSFSDLRESQLLTLKSVPNTGMAMTMDVAEGVVHFTNKQEAGRRLALWALANVYGQKDLVYSGPLYDSMSVEDNKIRIRFEHADSGLMTKDGKPVASLAIAGEDKKFVWADSKIDGNTLVVWSDQVAKPVAVRYAWGEYPPVNLYNKANLPASPFRTDDWPLTTQHKK